MKPGAKHDGLCQAGVDMCEPQEAPPKPTVMSYTWAGQPSL